MQQHGPDTRYQVRRTISDDLGEMKPGYLPPPERVALWPHGNLRSMVSCGYLSVYGGEDRPGPMPGAARKAATPTEPPKAKRPRSRARGGGERCGEPGCDWTGKRLKTHMTKAHS